MSPEQWRAAFDAALLARYGIGIADAGLETPADLGRWHRGYEDAPADAARAYGEKYDLDPVIDWGVIAPPRPEPSPGALRIAQEQAAESDAAYLRRLYQEQN